MAVVGHAAMSKALALVLGLLLFSTVSFAKDI